MTTQPDIGTVALRRQIATLLGYTVKQRDNLWDLIWPDGTRRPNYGADWAAWNATPNWTEDVNAALTLIDSVDYSIERQHTYPSHPYYVVLTMPGGYVTLGEASGDTLALAICRAWLEWKAKQV